MTQNQIDTVKQQREAFLSSPNLDRAWIAGWHAAIDHTTHKLMKEAINPPHQNIARDFVQDAFNNGDSVLGYDTTDLFGHAQIVEYNDDGSVAARYMVTVTAQKIED